LQLEEDIPDAEESKREGAIRHKQRLGESIVGDRRETSPYEVSFGDNVEWRLLCNKELAPVELRKFKDAIHNDYFFEMFVEDLPLWGYIGDAADEDMIVGETEGSKTYLFTHLHFNIGHNGNQIVSVKVNTDVSYSLIALRPFRLRSTFLNPLSYLDFLRLNDVSILLMLPGHRRFSSPTR
jgi:Endomembrane protein 70